MTNTTTAAAEMSTADQLRAALKAAGYSRKQVTVKHDHYSMGSTLYVTIRDASVPKSKVEAIAGSFEIVRRCESSGEILGGGNRFLHVDYQRDLLEPAARAIAEQLAAAKPNFRFGLFDRGELVGVAIFSRPWRPEVLTNPLPWLDDVDEAAELGRFVLLDSVAANGETWFLARCFALLRGRLRAVVSFSDPTPRTRLDGDQVFPGHIGTIYQASNANYRGTTNPATLRILPDGTVFSNISSGKIRRALSGWRNDVATLVAWGAGELAADATKPERCEWLSYWRDALTRPLRHRGLHRYTFTLDRELPPVYGPALAYPKQRKAG